MSVYLTHPLLGLAAAGRVLGRLLLVFVGRHWPVGLVNAAVTALAGLGLLWLAARLWPLRNSPLAYLRLRRLVYLIALYKGALYLIVGDNLNVKPSMPIGFGYQVPMPSDLAIFLWYLHYSIFNPTYATPMVSMVLLVLALVLFIVRARRVTQATRALASLDQFFGEVDSRTSSALNRAAQALKISPKVALPRILLVEVDCPTPLLLGVRNPRLLISPRLLAVLSEEELEVALRHELAHFKRKDHWWRWIQLWLEDIGRPILVAGRLGAFSVETEELLCDRLAVQSPQDAACLARAITKAAHLLQAPAQESSGPEIPKSAQSGLNDSVIPSFLGGHQAAMSEARSLKRRIKELLLLAHELDAEQAMPQSLSSKRKGPILRQTVIELPLFLLLALLLFGVLYARFHFFFNVH